MPLHNSRQGAGPRLVLVHGFTQTSRCWGPVADDLGADHELVLVDAPGHGGSAGVAADLPTGADLIVAAGGSGAYVGYSMGGRFCLHAALQHPAEVEALVLVSATAGIEDPTEREARREADRATADRLAVDGLERFVDDWLSQPLFAGLPPAQAQRDERLRNTVEGLRSSLLLAGTGSQAPLWSELHRLTMPVLMVAGEDDARYAALAQRMADAVGDNATVVLVPNAGHAPQLERPDELLAAVRPWLHDHVRPPAP